MNEKLVAFMYILMRDHLTVGEIEALMRDHVDKVVGQPQYSHELLEQCARQLVERLK